MILGLIVGALVIVLLSIWSCIHCNNSFSRRENEAEFKEFCDKFRNNEI